jgi:hypothetical protein
MGPAIFSLGHSRDTGLDTGLSGPNQKSRSGARRNPNQSTINPYTILYRAMGIGEMGSNQNLSQPCHSALRVISGHSPRLCR